MKKRTLEMNLERLEAFSCPDPKLEQYTTPASAAAELLYLALLRNELEEVCDLGCGTGVLAIGAALLGARSMGVEIDPQALIAARENAHRLGVHVDLIRGDVSSIALRRKVPTVIMNPPFGAQKGSAGDRAFLRKAMEIGEMIYSIHNAGSEGFIKRFVEPCRVEEVYKIPFPLKRCFKFHSRDLKVIEVELYRINCTEYYTE